MTPSSMPDARPRPSLARLARRPGGWAALLSTLALVVGCGGGGSDVTPTPTASAAAFTQGTVNGFGSVIVNGVRFVDTHAVVYDDNGTRQALSALRLGMRVTVDSTAVDASSASAHAHTFRFGGQVLGPITSVDTTASRFTLLGQGVDVTTATVFDDSLSGGLTALSAGTVVEVHGLPDAATGRIVATRIEAKTDATAYKLVGTVAALDTTAKTFAIGGATISYATLAATAVPATLADGMTLRVLLATAQTNGQWVATALGARTRSIPADNTAAHVRGSITAFTSATAFTVDGLVVDATNATFPDGSTGLGLGVEVDVVGTVSNGVLVATQVSLESRHKGDDSRCLKLIGAITAVDATAKTFVVRGVTVSYGDTTVYSPGTKTAADLLVGATVKVTGAVGSTRTQVQAATITFTTATP